jgi:hypothetical protein
MARYGYDPNDLTAARIAKATPQELADLALATGRTDLTLLLLEQAPGAVLPPIGGGTAVAVGDAPAGTGVTSPEDIYMADEVQTLLEASPEARTVYQDLGITRTMRMNINPDDPDSGPYSYRDAAGNILSAQQVADMLANAGTVTIPGGTTVVAPVGTTSPGPLEDVRLQPVDVATPVTVVPGGGGGGGGEAGSPGMTTGTPLDTSVALKVCCRR